MRAVAFCPAHITGFFKADLKQDEQNTENLGSLGAGFSIQNGVKTTVSIEPKDSQLSNFVIKTSDQNVDNTLVSEYIINEFLSLGNFEKFFVNVSHDIEVPVGYGLGCSGAVALSLAFALNKALDTKLSKVQVGQIAHKAEIVCKTGLGDVLASYHGGFEIRTKAGAPGIGQIEKIDSNSLSVIMICFAPISTTDFINKRLSQVNGLGGKMVNKLLNAKNSDEFQDMSIEFAKYVKVMTPRMKEVIDDLNNNKIKSGVALFGETIFSLVPKEKEGIVLDMLKKYKDGIIIKSKIDDSGVRLEQ